MKVMVLSSSRDEIDDYYKSIARCVSSYLAKCGFDLVFGGSSSSMMGICYEEFAKEGRNIYAFTTEKYISDLKKLKEATHYIKETTFDLKKDMFENADIIVALAGGIGTLSEILSYIEENRSNDKNIPIEIYDEDGYYDKLLEIFTFMLSKNFISESIINRINISSNKSEFEESILKHLTKGRR